MLLSFSTAVFCNRTFEGKIKLRAELFLQALPSALHVSCVLFTVSFCAVVSGMGSNGCLLQPSPSEKNP